MDSSINKLASRRFVLICRLMYLIAFALIGTGLYINYQDNLNQLGSYGEGTEYNIYDADEFNTKSDAASVVPLYQKDLDIMIRGLPTETQEAFDNLDDAVNVVSSLASGSYKTTRLKNNASLETVLAQGLRSTYRYARLSENNVKALTARDRNIRSLKAGQTLGYAFDETGRINAVTWLSTPKNLSIFVRTGDTYIVDRITKKSELRSEVVTFTVSGSVTETLRKGGIDNATINGVNQIMNWKGAKPRNGEKVRALVQYEYVGNERVSDKIIKTLGVRVTANGKNYFAIPYQNSWYDDKGFREQVSTFNRYPFTSVPRITSKFNPARKNPVTGRVTPHNGIDFGVPRGTPVIAPGDGVVTRVASQPSGAGNYIIIQHNSTYSTVYMHLTRSLVSVGQKVRKGERIALTGNTGRSTGPHLHYEIHVNGVPRNPQTVSLPTISTANKNNDRRFNSYSTETVRRLNSN